MSIIKSLRWLILIIFTITAEGIGISQQKITGVYNFQNTVCCFSKVEWEITCEFRFDPAGEGKGSVFIFFTDYGMSVANAKYQYQGKQYSPSDLGLSSWPVPWQSGKEGSSMNATVTILYKGSAIKSFTEQITDWGVRLGTFYLGKENIATAIIGSISIKYDDFKIQDFSAALSNFHTGGVNPDGGREQIYELVKEKVYPSNPGNSSESNKSSNVSLVNNASAQNTSGTPKTAQGTSQSTAGNSSGTAAGTTNSAQGSDDFWNDTPANKANTSGTGQTAWTQDQVEEHLAAGSASRQAQYDRIASDGKVFEQKIVNAYQSYYAAQAVNNARSDLKNNSTMDGNYSSIEEIEADFNSKYYAINENINDLTEANNAQMQAGYNYYFNDADASGQAIGQVAATIGTLINNAEAEKEKERARANLVAERNNQLAIIEAKKAAMKLELRRSFIARFPDGGVPVSAHKINSSPVYYFAYLFDQATISQASPTISISNIFPIARYSDGTWPYKTGIQSELRTASKSQNLTIVGYYTSRELAESVYKSFQNMAKKTEFIITSFSYKGKPGSSNTNSANTDIWGNSVNANGNNAPANIAGTGSTGTKPDVDEWGNPVRHTQGTPVLLTPVEVPAIKPKVDEWGNPIK